MCLVRCFRPLLVIVLTALVPTLCQSADKPNIILIMSDDMGFSDLGCYGGEINTPNLDGLANNGIRMTQFYNTARCCPTRASLLTGLYPHQAGMGHMTGNDRGEKFPGYRGNLNNNCRTIAEVLKTAGYGTYISGKWHVCNSIKPDGPKHTWPLQRGFDRFYGIVSGGASFYDPWTLCRDNTQISRYADTQYTPKEYYLTDAISDHAVKYIAEHHQKAPEKPFFTYVSYTAAHWPMHALPEDIAKYKGKYDAGYEAIRQARFEKAVKLGLIDSKQARSPGAEDWDSVKNLEREIACMEVYAAMVDRMDQGIGKIIAQLKKDGTYDNTLIFFLQDNGGCAEGMGRSKVKGKVDGPRASKPSLPTIPKETLGAALVPPQTRDGYPVRQGPNVIPGPYDTYIGYGRGWANVSNTPFREYKHWVHEGGISTPLIAHWPKSITAKGELRQEPGHLIDIMATCVEVSGAQYPKQVGDNTITPLEGKSLVPVFAGKPLERDAIYWEHEGNRAIRVGDWKAVAKGPAGKWELYNLATDRVESTDLAKEHPAKLKDLVLKWEAYAKRTMVLPWIWDKPYTPFDSQQ